MAASTANQGRLTIGEVMSPHPHTISCYESVSAAKKMMSAHHIRHLPAVDGKQIVGVLSERDIKAAESLYQKRNFEGRLLIREILLFEPYVVAESDTVHEVAAKMADERIGSAVVLRGGDVAGIFTTIDACRLLSELTK